MGTLADSLFTVLMGWVRGLVNALWALFSADHTTALAFLGKNWLIIAGVLIVGGLVIDWIIWLLRWQPYHLWAQRARRLLRIEEPEEDAPVRARAAAMPAQRSAAARPQAEDEYDGPPMLIDERDAQQVIEQAERAPDEYAYPGMRYDSGVQEAMDSTRRYGAVTQEGPGAAEVARRRAEIEAWQAQMREEARAKAEAARRAQEAQAAYEAEQARIAQEAQAAYEAEQARIAQEEYERQLAEYARRQAQYALDMAEYERQKAEYEAALAAQAEQEPARQEQRTYSDEVEGETVSELPDAPQWPQMEKQTEGERARAPGRAGSRLLGRMAKMLEPEEEQLATRTKLPPRVDVKDAYMPAKTPGKPGRRRRL